MLQLEFYIQYQDQRQAINYLWSYDFEFLLPFLVSSLSIVVC